MRKYWLIKLLIILLFGCNDSEEMRLKNYIASIKSRKPREIPAIPPFKSLSRFNYPENDRRRSPFLPIHNTMDNKKKFLNPILSVPINSFKWVGFIKYSAKIRALLRHPNGIVSAVGVGDYIGINSAKIIKITEEEMQLEELVDRKKLVKKFFFSSNPS